MPQHSHTTGRALRARTVQVAALEPKLFDAMWTLFALYYECVERPTFEQDLRRKDHVIILEDAAGRLCGFSTLQILRRCVDGEDVVAVFSGDTIVMRTHWGDRALAQAFFDYAVSCWCANPGLPVYWFLLSKGYRTYLLLARHFPEFWPRRGMTTPARPQRVIEALAREKFGDALRSDGILRFDECYGRLRADVAPIGPTLLTNPDVRFFAERNPGHVRGDELCCLGVIDRRLLAVGLHRLGRRSDRRSVA